MSTQRPRLKVLIANAIAAIIAVFVLGLVTSDAKTPQPSPFLSPTGLTPRAWLPVILNNFTAPPATTVSRYVNINSLDWQTFRDLGCNRATAASPGKDLVIILDFGYPADIGGGQYGVYLLSDIYTFRPMTQITNAVQGFMSGFYYCLPSGSGTHLTVAVGVNNSSNGVTRGHGAAWAQMVNYLNSWIKGPPGPDWSAILTAWGAIDAEPPYNSAAVTRAWADGYASAYSSTLRSFYLNFGSCDSCPYFGCPTCTPALFGWSLDDIWYVSWGITPAYSLPEIYTFSGSTADEWYRMSLYGYTAHNSPIIFKGSLTQWNACQENGGCIGPNDRSDNSPEQGYSQLYYYTNVDARTAQPLGWCSDMSWQK